MNKDQREHKDNKDHLLNHQIKASKVMLLDKDGEKVGEMTLQEALKKANDEELDLMQLGQNQDTAICKLLNYESWLYHENKKKHKQDVKNRSHELKTMNFRPVTGEHDFQLKLDKVSKFLQDNHKVKIVIRLKNREHTLRSVNEQAVQRIMDSISTIGNLDSKVNYGFKEINFILKPEKKPAPKMKM